jgi:TrmH family RNA methyltransferase
MFAARVDGAIDYWKADYTGRVALVFGSEAHGLSTRWQGPDITSVALPRLGQADSLNVSVTAAVLVYEALRQRQMRI